MRNRIFFLMLFLAYAKATKSRNINLALETVLEFNNKDDVKFIDNMQNFLEKIKRTILREQGPNDKLKKRSDNDKEDKKTFVFTDFLLDTIAVLRSFDDNDLSRFFGTLYGEIEAYHKINTSPENTDHTDFRRFVDRKFKTLKHASPRDLRRKLNVILNNLDKNKRGGVNGFVDFLNYFYRKRSQEKFSKFLNNLKLYRTSARRSSLDLKKILRNGFQAVVEPILNSNIIHEANRFYAEQVNYTDGQQMESLLKDIQEKLKKLPAVLKDYIQLNYDGSDENEKLDYIEAQKRIIEEHLTHESTKRDQKNTIYRTSTVNKYRTTRAKTKKKSRTTYSSFEGTNERIRKQKNKKRVTIKDTTRGDESDELNDASDGFNDARSLEDMKEPQLIRIGSSSESTADSFEDYISSTYRFKQKSNKKTTRSHAKKTSHKNAVRKKHARKAFKTTMASEEGLSIEHIEHFGSLVESKRRTIAEYDVQTTNTRDNSKSTTTAAKDTVKDTKKDDNEQEVTGVIEIEYSILNQTGDDVKVIETDDDVKVLDYNKESRKLYDFGEIEKPKTKDSYREDNVTKSEKNGVVTEIIRLTGNIVFEDPTTVEFRNRDMKLTSVKPVKSGDVQRTMQPNVTTSDLRTMSVLTTMKSTDNSERKSEATRSITKALDEGFENELDHNKSSSIPPRVDDFLKESENNVDGDVQKQVGEDPAKIATPPAAIVVTQLN